MYCRRSWLSNARHGTYACRVSAKRPLGVPWCVHNYFQLLGLHENVSKTVDGAANRMGFQISYVIILVVQMASKRYPLGATQFGELTRGASHFQRFCLCNDCVTSVTTKANPKCRCESIFLRRNRLNQNACWMENKGSRMHPSNRRISQRLSQAWQYHP